MNQAQFIENCPLSRHIEGWQGNVAILKNITTEQAGIICSHCNGLTDCDPSMAPLANHRMALTTAESGLTWVESFEV